MQTAGEFIPGLPGGGALPLADEASLRRELGEAGLANVVVHQANQQLEAPSFEAFWSAMERTNAPLVLVKHRLGAERWHELAPKIRERVRGTLGEGPADASAAAPSSASAPPDPVPLPLRHVDGGLR